MCCQGLKGAYIWENLMAELIAYQREGSRTGGGAPSACSAVGASGNGPQPQQGVRALEQ